MTGRTPRQRAEDEAQAMQARKERNSRCYLHIPHDSHVFRVQRPKAGRFHFRDSPCGGGVTDVDKEADRDKWDVP